MDVVDPSFEPCVDFEGELGVVIGRKCKGASIDTALEYVEGYCIANDVTGTL